MISAPASFLEALESLRGHSFRQELDVVQIAPPREVAPWSVALQATVAEPQYADAAPHPSTPYGPARGGTFILLFDEDGQPGWEGPMRIVCHVSSQMEAEMTDDPLLGEVAWSWLQEDLDRAGALYHNLVGTVTRRYNETFGGLELSSRLTDLELRGSWSPDTYNLYNHLEAWAHVVAQVCGLAPVGVTSISRFAPPTHD